MAIPFAMYKTTDTLRSAVSQSDDMLTRMKFLLLLVLPCVILVVESIDIGKGVAQRPLNNMLRLERSLTQLRSEVRELKDEKERSSITTERRKKVAFEVVQLRSANFGVKEPLKFDRVTLNTGNAYNRRSGIFLVPVSGTYLLWAHVMANGDKYFHIGLFREGRELTGAFTGSSQHYGTASINHVVQLKKGDHVWFTITRHSTDVYGNKHSSYGGTLMYT